MCKLQSIHQTVNESNQCFVTYVIINEHKKMMELDVHICVKKESKAILKDKDICHSNAFLNLIALDCKLR